MSEPNLDGFLLTLAVALVVACGFIFIAIMRSV